MPRRNKIKSYRDAIMSRVKVGRNEPCPCGSGQKYKRCHGAPRAEVHPYQQYRDVVSSRSTECLAGELGSCRQPAIKAHSIQNSQDVMGLLVEDGHVFVAGVRGVPPRMLLSKVGRNNASTFTGLCDRHDAEIFRPLDTVRLDPADPEQTFLLAYRALLREQHVVHQSVQSMRKAARQLGMAGRVPVGYHDYVATKVDEYRRKFFDPALVGGDYSEFATLISEVETSSPTVAASSLFSMDHLVRHDDVVRVALSVLPASQQSTVVAITCTVEDFALARPELQKILTAQGADLALRVSHLILDTSENFVMRPGFVSQWSETRKRKILSVAANVNALVAAPIDDDLMLFDCD